MTDERDTTVEDEVVARMRVDEVYAREVYRLLVDAHTKKERIQRVLRKWLRVIRDRGGPMVRLMLPRVEQELEEAGFVPEPPGPEVQEEDEGA